VTREELLRRDHFGRIERVIDYWYRIIGEMLFDAGQSEIALDAWRRYGTGRHPADLNLGACAAYALAALTNEKLLFKGEDFKKTDRAPRI